MAIQDPSIHTVGIPGPPLHLSRGTLAISSPQVLTASPQGVSQYIFPFKIESVATDSEPAQLNLEERCWGPLEQSTVVRDLKNEKGCHSSGGQSSGYQAGHYFGRAAGENLLHVSPIFWGLLAICGIWGLESESSLSPPLSSLGVLHFFLFYKDTVILD